MKMKTKILVAALTTAGIVAPMQQVWADTITPVSPPGTVDAQAQAPTPPANTITSFPVTVAVPGVGTTVLNLQYNSTTKVWNTNNAAWSFDGSVNLGQNTAVFTTTTPSGTVYSFALSNQTPGNNPAFGPAAGNPQVITPPSVGVDYTSPLPQPSVSSSLIGSATASGKIVGLGQTSAPLVGPAYTAAPVGTNPPGVLPLVASATPPSSTSASSGASGPGSAGGVVTVTANNANQSINFGTYDATFPVTPTPAGTTTISGTVAGSSGSMGASGIFLNQINGTATYNTSTGVINTTATATPTFSVMPNGDTAIGGTLSVAGETTTNGIANTGAITTGTLATTGNAAVGGNLAVNGATATGTLAVTQGATVGGNLAVNGSTTTRGIANTGAITTTTLAVSGATVTNGIVNTGNLANTATITTVGLNATGNATVGGTLGVTGAATLNGNATVGGTLGVTGATTLNGATQINNTLGVTGATTIGSADTGGFTMAVNSNGVSMSAPSVSGTVGNNVTVTGSGTSMTGGGAGLRMASGVATFGSTASGNVGAPIRVTGIADGSNQYDAVNFGQFEDLDKRVKRGISGAAAVANIPQVEQGRTFNLGVGVGGFDGETAVAVGGSVRLWKEGILKASVGFGGGGGSSTVWGVGGGWSWQ